MDVPMPAELTKLPAFEDITRRALNGSENMARNMPEADDPRVAALEALVGERTDAISRLTARVGGVEKWQAQHMAECAAPLSAAAEAPPTVPVVVHHDSSGLKYAFKWRPETLYAIATTCVILALESLADPSAITDWKKWGVALIGACVRATIGILQPRAPEVLTVPMDSLPAGTPVSVDGAARGFTTGAR